MMPQDRKDLKSMSERLLKINLITIPCIVDMNPSEHSACTSFFHQLGEDSSEALVLPTKSFLQQVHYEHWSMKFIMMNCKPACASWWCWLDRRLYWWKLPDKPLTESPPEDQTCQKILAENAWACPCTQRRLCYLAHSSSELLITWNWEYICTVHWNLLNQPSVVFSHTILP